MGYEEDKARDALTLEATYWIMDRETGMDNLYIMAGASLDKMTEDLGVELFRDMQGSKRLFLARFEFPKYGESFGYVQDIKGIDSSVAGFIHFLAGFPIDCCEMFFAIGEFSSKPDMVRILTSKPSYPCAPVPTSSTKFFKWPDEEKILLNLTALPVKNRSAILAENLDGEPRPSKLHWWFQTLLRYTSLDSHGNPTTVNNKYPVPGEFLALGVRMMPNKPWGKQKTSPFLYSGNWMDTVYYTSGVIETIDDPSGDALYATYTVRWRSKTIMARSTDFAEYKVGDRVTILKDVTTEKKSQLWKDGDMLAAGETWQIAPLTFYGLDKPEE